jgi:hypothetical protein
LLINDHVGPLADCGCDENVNSLLRKSLLGTEVHMNTRFKLHAAAASVALALGAASGQAGAVGLELLLLVDTSGSVSGAEYDIQKGGYVSAFQSAGVQNAILNSVDGSIAVAYAEWSGQGQHQVRVGWTLINSADSANAFAASINALTRIYSGSTGIQDAMSWGGGQFAANGFDAPRQVIDVSGDGADNDTTSCDTTPPAPGNAACGRDLALAAGVDAINGLPILGEAGLLTYYQTNVQGGGGSFTTAVNSFDDFAPTIENKLIREIAQVPEPGTMLLLGASLLGFGFARRRKV